MTNDVQKNIEFSKKWLSNYVYPLWGDKGVDKLHGGFVESLSFQGEPLPLPRRAMVQCRQIYSFATGARLGSCPPPWAEHHVILGTKYLVDKFSLPHGGFRYSIEVDGRPKNDNPDLYTQAFALFGLAQEFAVTRDPKTKHRALELLDYLQRERSVPGGGYTELDESGNKSYKSNPHMHLFEGAIAWMQVDRNEARWQNLGAELIELCTQKFIDRETGVIGEYFDSSWKHLKENGRFIFEPGHQYEWAWLMSLYQELTAKDLQDTRHRLFHLAEKYGTSPQRKVAYDEVWSDWSPKKTSSRFWPQCERIKAACRLGAEVIADQAAYATAADEALETLFKFFATPIQGMWFDQLSEMDTFSGDSSKSSSLYHIVNALEEYIVYRPKMH